MCTPLPAGGHGGVHPLDPVLFRPSIAFSGSPSSPTDCTNGSMPENAIEGLNSTGSSGWTPPCPPAGSGVHTYEVAVLALVDPVTVPLDAPAEQAAAALEAAATERAVLTGTVASG